MHTFASFGRCSPGGGTEKPNFIDWSGENEQNIILDDVLIMTFNSGNHLCAVEERD